MKKVVRILAITVLGLALLLPIFLFPISVGATGTLSNVWAADTGELPLEAAWGSAVLDNYWYITDGTGATAHLWVYNITNQTSPSLVGTWNYTSSQAAFCALYLYGNCAYVGEWYTSKVFCINITNKSAPAYVSNYTTPVEGPYHIAGNGTHMWVVSMYDDGNAYLQCVNITVPGTMTVLGSTAFGGTGLTNNHNSGLAITSDYHYAFTSKPGLSGVYSFDISGNAPVVLGNITSSKTGDLGGACSLAMDSLDSVLYVHASFVENITALDITNPASMSVISTTNVKGGQGASDTGGSYRIFARNETGGLQYVYLAPVLNTNPTLVNYDFSNPLAPNLVGSDDPLDSHASLYGICANGDYLYAVGYLRGAIEEITVPEVEEVSISVSPSLYPWGTVSANTIYTTPTNSTFSITNDGSVSVDVTIEATNAVGTPTTWTLSGTGTPGYATFGLWSWYNADYSVVNTTAQLLSFSPIAAGISESFGFKLQTPTGGMGTNSLSWNVTFVATQSGS